MKKATWAKMDEAPSEIQHQYGRFQNLDANESIFFARELEYVKTQVYDIKYPELKARLIFPIDFTVNAGAEVITYQQYDQVGIAKVVSAYADDLPRADIKGKEFFSKVRTIAMSFGYNYDELQAAAMANKPLTTKKANAAKRGHMILENKIAFYGDAENNLQGLFTAPNLTEVVLAADGTGSSKTFASKTADQILRDLNSLFTTVSTVTNGVEQADTLLVPIGVMNLLTTKRIDNTLGSVMKWFLDNSPYAKEVIWVNEMKGAGAGSTDRIVAYKRSADCLEMIIPSEFKQLPVQERNLEFVVPTHQRFGGLIVYSPLSIAYADGV